jgi:hypothetical protein
MDLPHNWRLGPKQNLTKIFTLPYWPKILIAKLELDIIFKSQESLARNSMGTKKVLGFWYITMCNQKRKRRKTFI